MGGKAWRSGEDVVSDKLPDGAFGELATGIWTLGRLLLPQELVYPMVPSTVVSHPRKVGALAVELSFDFSKDIRNKVARIRRYAATISEIEPYAPEPGAELWSGRCFEVSVQSRRVYFRRSTTISSLDTRIQLSDEPVAETAEDENEAWLAARRLAYGCSDDFLWFVQGLRTITRGLRSDDW
jgi:hypothetical protein